MENLESSKKINTVALKKHDVKMIHPRLGIHPGQGERGNICTSSEHTAPHRHPANTHKLSGVACGEMSQRGTRSLTEVPGVPNMTRKQQSLTGSEETMKSSTLDFLG